MSKYRTWEEYGGYSPELIQRQVSDGNWERMDEQDILAQLQEDEKTIEQLREEGTAMAAVLGKFADVTNWNIDAFYMWVRDWAGDEDPQRLAKNVLDELRDQGETSD